MDCSFLSFFILPPLKELTNGSLPNASPFACPFDALTTSTASPEVSTPQGPVFDLASRWSRSFIWDETSWDVQAFFIPCLLGRSIFLPKRNSVLLGRSLPATFFLRRRDSIPFFDFFHPSECLIASDRPPLWLPFLSTPSRLMLIRDRPFVICLVPLFFSSP